MWCIGQNAEDLFRRTCQNALTESHFKWIKSNPIFMATVGYSDRSHAVNCLKQVTNYPLVSVNMPVFALNDKLCGEQVAGDIYFSGSIPSYNVCREAESVALIYKNFNLNNSSSIIEIGAGIGILANMIITQWPDLKSYSIIDLPELTALALKYNKTLNTAASIIDTTPPTSSASLVIAEYSLTELDDNTIAAYYTSSIQPANGLFARFNFTDNARHDRWINQLKADFASISVIQESRGWPNRIVIAKKNNVYTNPKYQENANNSQTKGNYKEIK